MCWGGIHPPADDIPGRLIGEKIGPAAFHLAETYFEGCRKRFRDGPQVTRTRPCGVAFGRDGRKDWRH